MNIRALLALPCLMLLFPAVNAAEDYSAKAKSTLQQAYARHGGQQQARQQLLPVAAKKARFCAMCHGSDGNSTRSGMPSLAGERPEYLLRRWYQLKDGHGESETAVKMVRRIDEQQMTALALYFADIQRIPVDFDPDLAARGEPVFASVCVDCHQADGRGEGDMPVIAGQQPAYLSRTLIQFLDQDGWRHGSRMPKAIGGLSPIQLKSVAHYAASLGAAQ